MKKPVLNNVYWVFWFSTTILTGVLAGFMVSHSIMLGRFFNWFIESGNTELLKQTYVPFRNLTNAHLTYNIPLYLCFFSGIVFTVLSFLLKKDRIIAVIAGLSTFWVGSIFMISDLDAAEEAAVMVTGDPSIWKYYVSVNIPTHATFAVIYTVSLFLLLLIAYKRNKSGIHEPV